MATSRKQRDTRDDKWFFRAPDACEACKILCEVSEGRGTEDKDSASVHPQIQECVSNCCCSTQAEVYSFAALVLFILEYRDDYFNYHKKGPLQALFEGGCTHMFFLCETDVVR